MHGPSLFLYKADVLPRAQTPSSSSSSSSSPAGLALTRARYSEPPARCRCEQPAVTGTACFART